MKITFVLLSILFNLSVLGQKSTSDFVTTWKTNNLGTLSDSLSIYITADDTNFDFNFDVDWNNDGVFDTIGVTGDISHLYADTGIYTIRIRGNFPRIQFGWRDIINVRDSEKLISVNQWGDIYWKKLDSAFTGCWKMNVSALDTIALDSLVNPSLAAMFSVSGINADISHWDVSSITNMKSMFDYAFYFNKPLNDWDVSSVTDMSSMFRWAEVFNQPLDGWDVSSVVNMESMFEKADSFNQPINTWNVSSVLDISKMFKQAYSFNQPLNNWDISSVHDIESIFYLASSFNQNINNWDVSNIT